MKPTQTNLFVSSEKLTQDAQVDWHDWDYIIFQMSGGKDSIAALLRALEEGAPRQKMMICHQCVDGRGETSKPFFDWQSTEGYVRALAKHFGIPLLWVWREYGFWGEMHRENSQTAAVRYQFEGGEEHILPTKGGGKSTRRKFPAKSPNLSCRWCSSYLKITPALRAIRNIPAFNGTTKKPKRVLSITGERREESANRSKYAYYEDFSSNTRVLKQYRAVLDWTEKEVWAIMERWGIDAHPAYKLGFPRLSCMKCVFFSPKHWATIAEIAPQDIDTIADLEEAFGHTLDNKKNIRQMAASGKSMITEPNRQYVPIALNDYQEHQIHTEKWQMPVGAFGRGGGAL